MKIVFLSARIKIVSVIVVSAFPDCLGRYLWKRKLYLLLDPHKLHLYYQELWARNSWSDVVLHFCLKNYARKSCRERHFISIFYVNTVYKYTFSICFCVLPVLEEHCFSLKSCHCIPDQVLTIWLWFCYKIWSWWTWWDYHIVNNQMNIFILNYIHSLGDHITVERLNPFNVIRG